MSIDANTQHFFEAERIQKLDQIGMRRSVMVNRIELNFADDVPEVVRFEHRAHPSERRKFRTLQVHADEVRLNLMLAAELIEPDARNFALALLVGFVGIGRVRLERTRRASVPVDDRIEWDGACVVPDREVGEQNVRLISESETANVCLLRIAFERDDLSVEVVPQQYGVLAVTRPEFENGVYLVLLNLVRELQVCTGHPSSLQQHEPRLMGLLTAGR